MKRAMVALALLAGCGSSSSWSNVDPPPMMFPSALALWVAGDGDIWLGGATIWHGDGSGTWTERAPATPVPVSDFWGFSPNDIYAASDSRVLHWDGSAWTEVPPTTGVTFDALYRIWGTSGQNLWVANTDNSRIYHYDGTRWTVQTLQFVAADALWGASANDIWLSGTTDLYHYTGTTWTRYDGNDAPTGVQGLWGTAPNDVWAAGSFDELAHWNGSTWEIDEDADYGAGFNSIWGASGNDIYAVGDLGFAGHYNGDSWSVSQELGNTEFFYRVHGSGPGNVWATGANLQTQKTLVLRKD